MTMTITRKRESFMDEALEETHEFFGNLLLIFVGLHVSYLLLFKRPLAKFMLFVLNKSTKNLKAICPKLNRTRSTR